MVDTNPQQYREGAMSTVGNSTAAAVYDDLATLQRDGDVCRKGPFSRQWTEDTREDITTAFWYAVQQPGSAVGALAGNGLN